MNSTNLYKEISIYDTQIENFVSLSIAAAKSLQSCVTLCNPIDGSLPDSPVPGVLKPRTLE